LGDWLIWARKAGVIGWDEMEDRLRRPRVPTMWPDATAFMRDIPRYYRRKFCCNQARYCEICVEKDALSGVFEAVLDEYRVTLNVGRGYDSWSAAKDMADRLLKYADDEEPPILFAFSDFDPSGEHMPFALAEKLDWFAAQPQWSSLRFEIKKIGLNRPDIDTYRLPTYRTKIKDSRRDWFLERYCEDKTAELDALPPDELQRRIRACVEAVMDLDALAETRRQEEQERADIAHRLGVTT
jgi:hypothetical protein